MQSEFTTKIFSVGMHGNDTEECLHQQAVCKTLRFIIENLCVSDTHLIINLISRDNEKYIEPCVEDGSHGSYQCAVTVTGKQNVNKPAFLLEVPNQGKLLMSENCNIFQDFLSSHVSKNTTCNGETNVDEAKWWLKFHFITVFSLVVNLHGQSTFSAEDVDFVDFFFSSDALSRNPCYFHCKLCSFSVTQHDTYTGEIMLLNCLYLSFFIADSSLSNTVMRLSFECFCHVQLGNVIFDENYVDSHALSSARIWQTATSGRPEYTLPESKIAMRNVSIPNKGSTGYSFYIVLLNSMNPRSEVVFEDCSSRRRSAFVRYAVLYGTTMLLETINPFHKVFFLNTTISNGAKKFSTIVSVSLDKTCFILIRGCVFTHNYAFRLIWLRVSQGYVQLLDTTFVNNTGRTDGGLYVSLDYSVDIVSANVSAHFQTHTASLLGISDLGLLDKSLSVLQIKQCTFEGNKASDSGGAVFLDFQNNIPINEYHSEPDKLTLVSHIEENVFKNNVATNSGGAIYITSDSMLTAGEVHRPEMELQILSCMFVNNSAEKGGALLINSVVLSMIVNLSQFHDNDHRHGSIMSEGTKTALYFLWLNSAFATSTVNFRAPTSILVICNCSFVQNNVNKSDTESVLYFGYVAQFSLHDTLIGDNIGAKFLSFPDLLVVKAPNTQSNPAIVSIQNISAKNNTGFQGIIAFTPRGLVDIYLKNSLFQENFISNAAVAVNNYLEHSGIRMFVSACIFVHNYGETAGAIFLFTASDTQLNMSVSDSLFHKNTGKYGGAIFVQNRHTSCSFHSPTWVHISSSQFDGNLATCGGSSIYVEFLCPSNETAMRVILHNVEFENNIVKGDTDCQREGGALLIAIFKPLSFIWLHVHQCRWENNTSSSHGGALALYIFELTSIQITQSKFISNSAGVSSFGGACYFEITEINEEHKKTSNIHINGCLFTNNIATEGGSVFQISSVPLQILLQIQNSTFLCCNTQSADFIAVLISSIFRDSYFYHVLHAYDPKVSGLILKSEGSYLLNNLHFSCFETDISLYMNSIFLSSNKDALLLGNDSESALTALTVSCTKCYAKPFAMGNGTLQVYQNAGESHLGTNMELFHHYVHLASPCQPCPFGGVCSSGKVIALPNFWGYKKHSRYLFLSCPLKYCCNGIDVLCESYNICAPHRTGQLCGQCEQGFSESFMSTVCIPDQSCDMWWIWPLGFLLAFGYLVWYMYKGKLSHVFAYIFHKICACNWHAICVVKPQSGKEYATDQSLKNNENAYFDILVYFVNIMNIIKVQVEFENSEIQSGILHTVDNYFMKYLDIDIQQTVSVDVCLFQGMDAITKSLARPFFTMMVFIIWCLLYSLTSFLICVFSTQMSLRSFKLKLVEGYVETLKYSYSGFATATFILLSCVDIGGENYWKYNAEILCFSTLQKLVIIFAVFYTIPFVLISPVGGKLLRARAIGHVQLMFACIFPFPVLAFWGIWFLACNKNGPSNTKCDVQVDCRSENPILSKEASVLIETYQGAYKDKHSYWEGIIEIRKLIFCSLYLIQNNIHRLVFCGTLSMVCLVHHTSVYPFKHTISNRAETLSLSLLCLACITNGIKSVYPQSGLIVGSDTPIEQLIHLLNTMDQMFTIILLLYIISAEVCDVLKSQILNKHK